MPIHEVRSPAVGRVLELLVPPGAQVRAGAEILLLESMKMEVPVNAPVSGRLRAILVKPGDHVEAEQVLLAIEV